MSRREMVTGGAGFIGSHLAERLLGDGWRVTVVDDLSYGQREYVPDEAQFINASITEIGEPEMEGVDCVFHLAALSSVPECDRVPDRACFVNLLGTQHLLQLARDAGAPRFVSASSSAVYGGQAALSTHHETHTPHPQSLYALQKWYGEELLTLRQRDGESPSLAWLRLGNVYGPRQRVVLGGEGAVIPAFINATLQKRRAIVNGDGSVERCFVYVRDVVDAFVLAGERLQTTGCFNIGGEEAVNILDLLMKVRQVAGGRKHPPAYFAPPRVGMILRR